MDKLDYIEYIIGTIVVTIISVYMLCVFVVTTLLQQQLTSYSDEFFVGVLLSSIVFGYIFGHYRWIKTH